MHRRAASAASGVAVLMVGLGTYSLPPLDRYTPVGTGYRSSGAARAVPLPDDDARPPPGSDVRWLTDHFYEAETTTTEAPPPTTEPPTTEPATTVPATVVRTTSPATTPATAPSAPRATTAPTTASRASTGVSGACGGDLPPCSVMMRESGGDPTAKSPASYCGGRGCYGKWQVDPRTSQALGYPLTMDQYPESVQDEMARALWAGGAGCSHWGVC